jgi:phosphatidylinositol phospholipase C delta
MSQHPSPLIADEDDTHDTPHEQLTSTAEVTVPGLLQRGTSMTKVSGRKQKDGFFRLDPDQGQIIMELRKYRISASLL